MTRRVPPARRDACAWCERPLRDGVRADTLYCRVQCRQAAHRAAVRRSELARADLPLRLAYADPPYMGLARRYYAGHPDYAGEVDHRALLARLEGYDGWALSCSSRSVPAIAAMVAELAGELEDAPRLAVWAHRPAPHPTARIVTGWEGLWYRPARLVRAGAALSDVLADVTPRPRPTLPGSVTGMKPPAFIVWMLELVGARPGDALDDLFPGSGMVSRVWRSWAGVRDPGDPNITLWEDMP